VAADSRALHLHRRNGRKLRVAPTSGSGQALAGACGPLTSLRAMNTPAHLILGATVCGRAGDSRVTGAAIAGALLPDLSLFALTGWALFVQGLPSSVVFGQLYFSERWQSIFAIDNSFPIWLALFGVAVARRSQPAIAFTGSALLHLVADFLLHHDDARRMFWPITDWVFRSPVSYWDGRHFGQIVGPIEIAASLLLSVVLWRRATTNRGRLLVALLALSEAAPPFVFALLVKPST
jgi:hypothetical protein